MTALENFHFLRPFWLLAVPVLALVWWLSRRQDSRRDGAAAIIAAHLRAALTINAAGAGVRPADGVIIAAVLVALAAAGPAWNQAPSPWFAETAPLVIALEVSDSMRSIDVQPTRLDRARFKILDLATRRTGGRTAIIVYAGSAHILVPPSSDTDVLKPLLESLDPAIMPVPGAAAAAALPLAKQLLADEATRGSVLYINDGFSTTDLPELAAFTATEGNPGVTALVIGTDAGGSALLPDGSAVRGADGGRLATGVDAALLARMQRQAGVPFTRMTTGDSDLREILRRIDSHLSRAADPDARWQDAGWWLLWPAALLLLAWFRRGWTMRW